ncbi:GNAT family N-acetyltransferase [Variovorax sp. H27-G14]|uniref:GNAT family N-acetyltransferase n=1 Tax=Variovorax sp. H27-G14 TaxID=3111914 RepID=UPI0038FC64C8
MSSLRNVTVAPASDFGAAELTALWNRAYEGYFVPIAFDEQRFARHLRRGNVDLALSRVMVADGAACGISLVGRRGERAYLAGFGIGGSHRRQGLAGQLIGAQIAALSQARIGQALLEVIEQNPARALYRQAGFTELRMLEVLEWGAEARAFFSAHVPAHVLDTAALAAVHAACSALCRPTWRRELPTVQDAVEREGAVALGVRQGAATRAYAVLPRSQDPQGVLLDAAAIDNDAAHQLLDMLALAHPGVRWRLVDEPPDSALCRAAFARGAATVIRQVEMALTVQTDAHAHDQAQAQAQAPTVFSFSP